MKKLLVLLLVTLTIFPALFAAPSLERYMAPSAQYGSSESSSSAQQAASLSEMLYALGNLYTYLDANFLYDIDSQKMQDAVISAMIDSLGDKYSYYITPEDAEEFNEDTTGKYVGIGIYLTKVNPTYIDWNDPSTYMVVVTSPFPGAPADRAGIRAGDYISHVDGQEVYELDANEASKLIRGKEGTPITLTLQRGSTSFDVTLTPEEITSPSTERGIIADDIGYIRILEFSQTTQESFREDVADLLEKGAESFIIDLRNNRGGSVDSALGIANMFIGEGKTLMTTKFKEKSNNKDTVYTSTGYLAVDESVPVVLLVNGGTASASEILTGALRDNDRALTVGTQTFGKGIMQFTIAFMGGYLNVTVAHYYTPSGADIHEIGIAPDYLVEVDEEYSDEEMDAYSAFLNEDYIEKWLEEYPDYTKENILAFAEHYKDTGVPEELLCLLMRNEYIYSLDYDKRPVADLDFDTQLVKAVEVVKSGITVEEFEKEKELMSPTVTVTEVSST
ncbi:MAG: S41 family peptidase [Candidatus Ornithospirochaeta sp.]